MFFPTHQWPIVEQKKNLCFAPEYSLCPSCLVVPGAAEWVWTRAKGQERSLSPGSHFNYDVPSFFSLPSFHRCGRGDIDRKSRKVLPMGIPLVARIFSQADSLGVAWLAIQSASPDVGGGMGTLGRRGLGGVSLLVSFGVLYSRSGERTCCCLFMCGFDAYPYHALFIQYCDAMQPSRDKQE